MKHWLRVSISPELDAQILVAAGRSRLSKGDWVRRALSDALRQPGGSRTGLDPLARLGSLNAHTADIDEMISEIGAGRA